MGNQPSIKKINFEDMQQAIQNKYIIINTLSMNEQDFLIEGTVHAEREIELLNDCLRKGKKEVNIIVYGKNSNDESIFKKYEQLISLGFLNTYLYFGGLFEWILLQDIYGDENFPTTKKILDILKYRPRQLLNIRYIEDG
jgi:hypothetical protein